MFTDQNPRGNLFPRLHLNHRRFQPLVKKDNASNHWKLLFCEFSLFIRKSETLDELKSRRFWAEGSFIAWSETFSAYFSSERDEKLSDLLLTFFVPFFSFCNWIAVSWILKFTFSFEICGICGFIKKPFRTLFLLVRSDEFYF